MKLNAEEYEKTKRALSGESGQELCSAIFNLALGRHSETVGKSLKMLEELEWYSNGRFTRLGEMIKDPIREYGFWLDRDRKLPSEGDVDVLNRERFRGKRVLELGSGGGCNLMSLSGVPSQLTGLEPVPIYIQLMTILSTISGIEPIEVITGRAENIPVNDSTFDVVLCYTSHQYMDIKKAVREISRVLDADGELILVGDTFHHFVRTSLFRAIRKFNFRKIKFHLIATLNTIYYQAFSRYFLLNSFSTTANPIYPSFRYMKNLLMTEGLELRIDLTSKAHSGEYVLVAKKTIFV